MTTDGRFASSLTRFALLSILNSWRRQPSNCAADGRLELSAQVAPWPAPELVYRRPETRCGWPPSSSFAASIRAFGEPCFVLRPASELVPPPPRFTPPSPAVARSSATGHPFMPPLAHVRENKRTREKMQRRKKRKEIGIDSYSFYNISLTRAAATKSTTSSGVAWVWMTEDAVTGDELRRGRPRRAPGIADSGDELQRGHRGLRRRASAWREARTAEDVAAATSPAWGATTEDAADNDVVAGLLPGAPAPPSPSTAPPLTPTSGSIRVASRRALRQRPNSITGPLQSPPSSLAVDPAANPGLHPIHLPLRGAKRQDGVQRAC
uniref:Uncharacterized protein n=1 Tax=Oryza sativa subsp. japonica TaxID=39947 RepID=Q9AUM2_ORYSJ|nr:hypothetical protein [Oryza sativa Japonica Group]